MTTTNDNVAALAPRQCPACGSHDALAPVKNVSLRARVGDLEQAVARLTGEACGVCEETLLDDASSVRYAEALDGLVKARREAEGEELKRVRKKLGLTQRDAGLLVGGGPNGMSRWERGTVEPPQPVRTLFGLLDLHPNLLKDALGANLRARAEETVAALPQVRLRRRGQAMAHVAKSAAGSALTPVHPSAMAASKKKDEAKRPASKARAAKR